MFVFKPSQRRQSLLLLLFFVFTVVAIYLFTRTGFRQKEEGEALMEEASDVSSSRPAVFTNQDLEFFGDPRSLRLKDRRAGEETVLQTEIVPLGKETVLPPKDLSILDPGVGRKLILSWKNASDSPMVRIYRSVQTGELGIKIVDRLSNKTSYVDTDVENNSVYYYTVRAVNNEGRESSNVRQVAGTPTDHFPPRSPTVQEIRGLESGKEVRISWIPPLDADFDHVRIYRSEKRGELGIIVLDVEVSTPVFIDSTVVEGASSYYVLTALDTSGNESSKVLLPVPGNLRPFESRP